MDYTDFKKKYNIRLNNQQESAVLRVDGQTLLLAVPGSGKTTVIVARLGYMIIECGIKPENILTMTYNVSAAADMKKRFSDKFGDELCKKTEFRTINGFCATVIMYYERTRNTNAFTLAEESQITRIIRAIYLDMTAEYPSESTIKDIKTKLVYSRNMMLNADEIKKIKIGETDFYDFFIRYKNYKQQSRIMDYDDQLEFALKILVKNPDILNFYQNRFRYICIDEAQDTSKIQHMIIRLLAGRYKNIFMVGDEDQSIYGFRAAYPQALLEFGNVYPNSQILLMEKNYRSTQDIVNRANNFIKLNKCRHDKNMSADCPVSVPVKNIIIKDCKYQYNYIMKKIEDTHEELAILYRNNDSALPLIDLFEKNNISYRVKENDGIFFSINTITDIMNILKFAYNPSDSALFNDFYYKIGSMIKKNIVTDSITNHNNPNISFFRTLELHPSLEKWQIRKLKEIEKQFLHLKKMNSYNAIIYILNKMDYQDYMKKRGLDDSKIRTLLALANQNPELPHFIERIYSLKRIVNNGSPDPDSNIILSTIHSSKGLEYENVLIMDVRDGVFPSVDTDGNNDDDLPENLREELEEERRLFYVGITRAKKKLEILDYEAAYGEKLKTASFIRQLLATQQKTPKKKKDINKEILYYKKGVDIIHAKFGHGIIQEINPPVCKVCIDTGEIKSFDIYYCLENEIIKLKTADN